MSITALDVMNVYSWDYSVDFSGLIKTVEDATGLTESEVLDEIREVLNESLSITPDVFEVNLLSVSYYALFSMLERAIEDLVKEKGIEVEIDYCANSIDSHFAIRNGKNEFIFTIQGNSLSEWQLFVSFIDELANQTKDDE